MNETWAKFDAPDDEEPSHEAVVIADEDQLGYTVEWDHVAVGLVTSVRFATLDEAHHWLTTAGYIDFTAG